jgi:hypothetical protein
VIARTEAHMKIATLLFRARMIEPYIHGQYSLKKILMQRNANIISNKIEKMTFVMIPAPSSVNLKSQVMEETRVPCTPLQVSPHEKFLSGLFRESSFQEKDNSIVPSVNAVEQEDFEAVIKYNGRGRGLLRPSLEEELRLLDAVKAIPA